VVSDPHDSASGIVGHGIVAHGDAVDGAQNSQQIRAA
jgi:hypothetical protein